MQGAWDGGQAGRQRKEAAAGQIRDGGRDGEAAGEEGKHFQGWQAQLYVEGSMCTKGHRGVTSFPPVKWDCLVSGGLQHIWAQLAPVQATFSSFVNPISLEVLLKPGDFSIDPVWNSPKQPPNAHGVAAGSPPHTPQAAETPTTCHERAKPPVQPAGVVLGRQGGAALGRAHTHRGVLALDAGAVEAQGRDARGAAGDVEDALVVALA